MTGAWWQYVSIFSASVCISWVITPFAIKFATRHDVLDTPGGHKNHKISIPYLGGLAIVVAFSAVMAVPVIAITDSSVSTELISVIGIALFLAVLGLVDDLRGLSSILRLFFEVSAGIALWNLDLRVNLFQIEYLDFGLTVFWVVGVTNAFNLLDNMDGLSAGIAAIACGSFFVIAATNGQYLVASLALALVGCATGFLRHNFYPARIYMGDSGALFLGFLVSFLGLKLQLDSQNRASFIVPIMVCSVAVLDTTLVTIARLRHGLSPFQGGRDHLSHRLVALGLPVPVAVGVLYVAAGVVGVLALVVERVDRASAWTLAGLVGTLLLMLGVLAYNIPVYPNSKRRLFTLSEVERKN